MLAQFGDTQLGLFDTLAAFERKRRGNDSHRKDAGYLIAHQFDFLGDGSHHGSGARSRSAPHTGGNEQHTGILYLILDFFVFFFGGGLGHFRHVARTQTFAQMYLYRHRAAFQSLGIGIAHNKINTFDAGTVHVVHRIAATAAHANHLDVGRLVFGQHKVQNVTALIGHFVHFRKGISQRIKLLRLLARFFNFCQDL